MKARLRRSEAPSEPRHFHFQHCGCRMNIFYEVLGGRCTGWSEEKLEVGHDSGLWWWVRRKVYQVYGHSAAVWEGREGLLTGWGVGWVQGAGGDRTGPTAQG